LEGGQHVGEAKRHHEELEEALVGAEGRLFDVQRVHLHLMVAGAKVELGEECCAVQLIQQFLDHGDWELILHGGGVQRPVIDAKALGVVALLDQQHQGGER
jgi:hypothetical protein